ncbi:transposase [Neoroseomonas lacus]|uniref:transposase n=1 Tax=Neoroseomonas lacus TaxID=287609 RepID=UPI00166ECD2D|nr:transposase [Neoroseomonas lacus]
MIDALPPARDLIADRGYDSDPYRAALLARGISSCIPPRKNRKTDIPYDRLLYRQRHRVEIMFGRLKDWRRVATRYDRCAHTCSSAICIAATINFWIGE